MSESQSHCSNEVLPIATDRAVKTWKSLLICGSDEADRLRAIQQVISNLPQNIYAIVIGPGSLEVKTPALLMPVTSSDADGAAVEAQAFIRSALRQDPDLILVTEPPPAIWASIATAAETGHLLIVSASGPRSRVFASIQEALAPTHGQFLPGEKLNEHIEAIFQCSLELSANGGIIELILPEPPAPKPVPAIEKDPFPDHLVDEDAAPLASGLLDALRRFQEQSRRPCYAPIFGEGPGPAEASKFGGCGMLAETESWPQGGETGNPMQLVFQLRIDELPAALRARLGVDSGWWQFFYDTGYGGAGAPWEPFSSYSLLRVLSEEGAVAASEAPATQTEYRERVVSGWLESADAPHSEDRREFPRDIQEAVDLLRETFDSLEQARLLSHQEGDLADAARSRLSPMLRVLGLDSFEDLEAALSLAWNRAGDKLLGWPTWAQGNEIPSCPKSGEPMRFLGQISANDSRSEEPGEGCHFPMLFAADGWGQIFQSPLDPSLMTFVWACG